MLQDASAHAHILSHDDTTGLTGSLIACSRTTLCYTSRVIH